MDLLLPLGTALVLGCLHALEADHMLAVTAFVSRRPALATAAGFGFRWGLGHSAAVLLLGGLLLLTGFRWDPRYDRLAEAAVGLALVGLGLWAIRSTRNLHVHLPAEHGDHAHLHVHPHGVEPHRHPHPPGAPSPAPAAPHHVHRSARGVTAVGVLHGLAGTSGAVALVPVTLTGDAVAGLAYLVAFGVGVTTAMTLYAALALVAFRQASARSLAWGRAATRAAGLAGMAVGVWWVVRAAGG